ncbi:F-box protein VBF-like [Silene latifolia]|uniref:F-box protein VBF-like n=1 Tax=Silene latifolia TaxID=37657 RepID=UPI003D77C1AD
MKNLNKLPDDCINTILSSTSPRDICRLAATWSELRLVAASDFVWESFLPHDYTDIISRACPLLMKCDSMKELFFVLCNSIFVDDGKKIFNLDRNSGRKSYILSARELTIIWATNPLYWCWKNVTKSRFDESVELRTTWWLEIEGSISIKLLSPNTTYGAYLIFNVSERAFGLDTMPMETSITLGNDLLCNNTVYLRQDYKKQQIQWLLFYNRTKTLTSRVNQGLEGSVPMLPGSRQDGWMEIELGHFYSGKCIDKEVKMSLKEIKGHHLKGGLIIEGLEIRPLTNLV